MSSPHTNRASGEHSDVLVEDDSLPGMDNPDIVQALEEYRTSIEEKAAVRERLLRRHPEFTVELIACLDALDFLEKEAPRLPTCAVDSSPSPRALGDFHLLREVGRGGMGIVYEAVQFSLGRRVAVKILQHAHALEPTRLQRFENEARTTALLRHPGIVCVLLVGCQDGVHYSVMDFIDGQSLADVLHARRSCSPDVEQARSSIDTAGLYPGGLADCRAIARLGVQAAAALAHAHQSGVIHRDIKPANLLLDTRQNLLITDFGLAHVMDASRLTHTGDFLGTLRYTSPEQTRAAQVVVDHRTDIYSLGVTLYELLTGRPPFTATDHRELLRQINFDEPPPLRQLDRSLPVELQTIVHKAMARDRDERYATAQELADDLQRFVDGVPIRARRLSWLARVQRWSRRRLGTLCVVGGLTVLALAGGLVSLARVNGAIRRERNAAEEHWQQAEHAREQAEQSRQQAVASLGVAQQAIGGMLMRLSVEHLRFTPQMDQLRRDILADAAACAEKLERMNSDDPAIRREVARVRAELGLVQYKIGESAAAERSMRDALAAFEALKRQGHLDAAGEEKMFWMATNLGWLLGRQAGRQAEVASLREKAHALAEDLAAQAPASGRRQQQLASACIDLGHSRRDARPDEARALYERAIDVAGRAAQTDGNEHSLGRAMLALGEMKVRARRWGEAEAVMLRAEALFRARHRKSPAVWQTRERLGDALILLARVRSLSCGDAAAPAREAVAVYQALLKDYPQRAEYRDGLARAAARLLLAVRPGEGRPADASVRALARDLSPDRGATATQLAWALACCPQPDWRDPARAHHLAQSATQKMPRSPGAWRALAAAALGQGRPAEALAALRWAVALGRGGEPTDWLLLAQGYAGIGRPDEASRWLRRPTNGETDRELLELRSETDRQLRLDDEKPSRGR